MPTEDFIVGYEDVAVTVTIEVNEFEIWIASVDVREPAKRAEWFPACIRRAPVEAGCGLLETDEVLLTVTGEVHELGVTGQGKRRSGSDHFDWSEARFDMLGDVVGDKVYGTEVAFVEPAAGLFGENARQTFTIDVKPLVV